MNFIAFVLLSFLSEEHTFWVLCTIVERLRLRDFYRFRFVFAFYFFFSFPKFSNKFFSFFFLANFFQPNGPKNQIKKKCDQFFYFHLFFIKVNLLQWWMAIRLRPMSSVIWSENKADNWTFQVKCYRRWCRWLLQSGSFLSFLILLTCG